MEHRVTALFVFVFFFVVFAACVVVCFFGREGHLLCTLTTH